MKRRQCGAQPADAGNGIEDGAGLLIRRGFKDALFAVTHRNGRIGKRNFKQTPCALIGNTNQFRAELSCLFF
jgi:tRNA U34 5-methylaminomethyl-2-thiouridine-forming methyltransferase MnmC